MKFNFFCCLLTSIMKEEVTERPNSLHVIFKELLIFSAQSKFTVGVNPLKPNMAGEIHRAKTECNYSLLIQDFFIRVLTLVSLPKFWYYKGNYLYKE